MGVSCFWGYLPCLVTKQLELITMILSS